MQNSFSLIVLLVALCTYNAFTQSPLPTRSATHIYWQPNQPLHASDYRAKAVLLPMHDRYCDSFNLCTQAAVGLFGVVDFPKRKKDRGTQLEKVYFAPAFEYAISYFDPRDTVGLAIQQVVYDMHELAARMARKELKQIEDSVGVAYGTRSIFFTTIKNKVEETLSRVIQAFTHDVYLAKRDGALETWKKSTQMELESVSQFATTPEDCYRFVKNAPIEEGYVVAKKVLGDLRNKE